MSDSLGAAPFYPLSDDLLNSLSLGIVHQNADGKITAANAAAENILGLSLDQMRGITSVDPQWLALREDGTPFLGEDHPAMITLKTGQAVLDVVMGVFNPKHGTRRWINVKTFPIRDPAVDRILGVYAIFEDISEVRQAQATLRQSQVIQELFIRHAPAAIAMFDTEMRYLAASKRWHDDYGLEDQDIIGISHYEIFPDLPERWKESHRQGMNGELVRCDEDRVEWQDGSVQWIKWEIRPWHSEAGQVGGIVIFAEDITKTKTSELELLAAKAEAERANDAKSRFLASASHDLRQPLQALTLYLETFRTKLVPGQESAFKRMELCLTILQEQLNDLFDLAKLDSGATTPQLVDFPIAGLLGKILSTNAPAAQGKNLRLRLVDSTLTVRTDPMLFERIVGNLVSNAIRYTEQGGVAIGVRRRQGQRWVEIWDTGIGIPEDKTSEIFEEFRQLGNAERSRDKGSGLGLSIAAKAAAILGVRIRVASRPGRGSMFAVELPAG